MVDENLILTCAYGKFLREMASASLFIGFMTDWIDWYAGEIKKKCEEEINTSAEREIKIFHGPFIKFFSIQWFIVNS